MPTSRDQLITKGVANGALAALLALATYVRFRDLERTSLWYDEAVSWSQSNGTFLHLITSVANDNYPPLHNMILWLTIAVMGDSETALRLPSAFLGVIAVWLLYLLGHRLDGRWTGLLAASLLALSPFHIWYSSEARMYALFTATGLLFLFAVLTAQQKPTLLRLLGLAFSGALFLYSHVFALFGFAGVGIVCAAGALKGLNSHSRSLKPANVRVCQAMAGSILLFLPWLLLLVLRAFVVADHGFWISVPNNAFFMNMATNMAGSQALFWCLFLLAAVPVFQMVFVRQTPEKGNTPLLIVTAFTFLPAGLAYIYSVLVQPILYDRYLSAAWPGLLLLASIGAVQLVGQRLSWGVLAVALYLNHSALHFTLFEKTRPEWRQVARAFKQRAKVDERLILYKGFAAPALEYYLRGQSVFFAVDTLEQLANAAETHSWLLLVHSNRQEVEAALQVFDPVHRRPLSKTFGWGASGLSLYARELDNKSAD